MGEWFAPQGGDARLASKVVSVRRLLSAGRFLSRLRDLSHRLGTRRCFTPLARSPMACRSALFNADPRLVLRAVATPAASATVAIRGVETPIGLFASCRAFPLV